MGDKVNNDVCGAVALGGTLVRIIDDENRTTTEAIGDETDADPMVGTILRDIWPNIVALLLVGGWRCWGGRMLLRFLLFRTTVRHQIFFTGPLNFLMLELLLRSLKTETVQLGTTCTCFCV